MKLYCVLVVKHVTFFIVSMKLTMAFTFTSLPLNFTLMVLDVAVVSDLNKNIGGSVDLVKKGTDQQICIPLFTPTYSTGVKKKRRRGSRKRGGEIGTPETCTVFCLVQSLSPRKLEWLPLTCMSHNLGGRIAEDGAQ